jgi:hypothetical protein
MGRFRFPDDVAPRITSLGVLLGFFRFFRFHTSSCYSDSKEEQTAQLIVDWLFVIGNCSGESRALWRT